MHKVKYFLKQSWLLMVSAFFFGILVAATNAMLAPKIEQNKTKKLNGEMSKLIIDANSFEKVAKVAGNDVYRAIGKNGQTAGFAFIATGNGFADKITLVIAVDAKCQKYLGFGILESNETPGFGDKIKKEFFQNQFKLAPFEKLKLTKVGDPVDIDSKIVAITGATISSDSVVSIFNSYRDKVKDELCKKGLTGDGR